VKEAFKEMVRDFGTIGLIAVLLVGGSYALGCVFDMIVASLRAPI
jgi:hypothetical protein